MKITYIKLVNVAGIHVGAHDDILEIDFKDAYNKIVSIQGANSSGKSTLLSSLTPFPSVTSLDERSSLPYIIPGREGSKEIHYQDGDDVYVIKHTYKPRKDGGHTTKSNFSKNGEELNKNGNVSSFLKLVELHMGITPEMLRLLRLGSNVKSFVTLTPAGRKEYIGQLIEDIDIYLEIHKEMNDELKVVRTLLKANNQSIYDTHIDDVDTEKSVLKAIDKDIHHKEKEHDRLTAALAGIQQIMAANDINDLQRRKNQAENSIAEFDEIDRQIKLAGLEKSSLDELIQKRNKLSEQKTSLEAKITSTKMMIDQLFSRTEQLSRSVKRISTGNDLRSLQELVHSLQVYVNNVPESVKNFRPSNVTSTELVELMTKLNEFNRTVHTLYSYGDKPLDIYLDLITTGASFPEWFEEQRQALASRVNSNDLTALVDTVFGKDVVILPACNSEFQDCPYYRLANVLVEMKNDREILDTETLNYVNVIYRNMASIFRTLDITDASNLPAVIGDILTRDSVLTNLSKRRPPFDTYNLSTYLNLLTEFEVYRSKFEKLKEARNQLDMYQRSGIDAQLKEIEDTKAQISKYKDQVAETEKEISSVKNKIEEMDRHIGLLTKYTDSLKYRTVMEDTLTSVSKILEPLMNASQEQRETSYKLSVVDDEIRELRERYIRKEAQLNEYKRLVDESKRLNKRFTDMTHIMEAVSTTKGIPVIYMSNYLDRIQKIANNLLQLTYGDDLTLAKFKVTKDTFEIPFIRGTTLIPDIRYASQSELSLVTMALSFALVYGVSGNYNILLLDEVDAGLDEDYRYAFLTMLDEQMSMLNAEQVFVISHNLGQMSNVAMDAIKMSSSDNLNKLQNVIFER